nr:putative integron gene cassette protein [uncultured bacterium]
MATGGIVLINCATLAWATATCPLESREHWQHVCFHLLRLGRMPLFFLASVVCGRSVVWKAALISLSLPYTVWGIIYFIVLPTLETLYLNPITRITSLYLLFLSPVIAAILLFWAVIADVTNKRRPAAHWLGVIVFLIFGCQSLYAVRMVSDCSNSYFLRFDHTPV